MHCQLHWQWYSRGVGNGSVWGRCPRPPCSTHLAGQAAPHPGNHSRPAAVFVPSKLRRAGNVPGAGISAVSAAVALKPRLCRHGATAKEARWPGGPRRRAGTANCEPAAASLDPPHPEKRVLFGVDMIRWCGKDMTRFTLPESESCC